MQSEFGTVKDHEEWARLTADAEGCVFKAEVFYVHNSTKNKPVRKWHTVEQAVTEVARRKGWGGGVVGAAKYRRPGEIEARRGEGEWWITVPIDYLNDVDDPAGFDFFAELPKRSVSLRGTAAWFERYEAHPPRG